MKKLTFYGMSATLLIAFSSVASAAHIVNPTYDFGHDAIGNEFGALMITSPDIVDRKGSNFVTARAYEDQGALKTNYSIADQAYFAYLDDFSGQNEGGLGVCKELTGNQCVPGNDDSVTKGEVLRLSFNAIERIEQIEFHNADHKLGFTGDVDISVDGGAFMTYALAHILDLGLTGTNFLFRNGNAGESVGEQFYVTAINTTPIPAAVWLFVSGLGSLSYFRKKKSNLKLVA
ncbi:MAG: hypothetical protein KAH08_02030 [Methylococcales bacterium]|nr:hypothetical protein [Methylococcales bacterium]